VWEEECESHKSRRRRTIDQSKFDLSVRPCLLTDWQRIDLPGTIHAARQGPISCVATDTDYALLDIENSGKISLPSIVSSSESTELSSNTVEIPDERRNPSPAPSSKGSSRSNTPLGTKPHPPRTSSLQRARSGDFSAHSKDTKEELKVPTPSKHARAVSTGSIRGVTAQPSGEIKAAGLPTRSRSTNGGSAGLLSPPTSSQRSSTTSRSPSPRAPSRQDGKAEGGSQAGQEEPLAPSTTSKSQSPSPANTPPISQTPPPTERALETPDTIEAAVAKPKPKEKVQLKPNIITPSATEFLITTGTGKCDPGVGIFVDINGDVTRGTINFERYPERLLLDSDGWLLSLLSQGPDKRTMIEIFKWDENQEERGIVELPSEEEQDGIGIKDVKSEISFSVADIGKRLMFVRIIPTEQGGEHTSRKLEAWEESRMDEEIQAARRISGAESRILLWNNTKIWGLVRSPPVLKLDGRLPMDFSGSANGAKVRIQAVMKVLKDVEGQQPETERHFHELAYIRQKSGMLLLAELLASSHSLDTGTVLAVESVLLEGGLDPRVVVALFPSFKKEVIEGKQGLWVYAGIKQVYDALLERDNKFSGGEADLETGTLLILKRYLAAWRSKKGFGSVLDEKEVFLTVDAVLLSVLLRLDSSATTDGMVKASSHAELYKLVDSGLDCFDRAVEILEEHKRLYLLSWLYQSKKKVTEVLQTWRRILESEVGDEEFVDGEERMKEYLIARRTKELVLDYGVWLAGRNPEIGFRVFADPRARIKWEPREILEILREKAPLAYRKFLEHLVHDNKVMPITACLYHANSCRLPSTQRT
jgi:vacuolar protein sorting-associated protein 3